MTRCRIFAAFIWTAWWCSPSLFCSGKLTQRSIFAIESPSLQADGDNDTGSLGALLNDVSKAVSMNTGFRLVSCRPQRSRFTVFAAELCFLRLRWQQHRPSQHQICNLQRLHTRRSLTQRHHLQRRLRLRLRTLAMLEERRLLRQHPEACLFSALPQHRLERSNILLQATGQGILTCADMFLLDV